MYVRIMFCRRISVSFLVYYLVVKCILYSNKKGHHPETHSLDFYEMWKIIRVALITQIKIKLVLKIYDHFSPLGGG